ncbi:DUF3572 family protein, partial [Rhizobium leguminosarum]
MFSFPRSLASKSRNGWLADDPDMFGRFLALTGVAPGQVHNAVNDPGFLA